jgi:hypothetical protein
LSSKFFSCFFLSSYKSSLLCPRFDLWLGRHWRRYCPHILNQTFWLPASSGTCPIV